MVNWWLRKLGAEEAQIDFAEPFIEDYAERTTANVDAWRIMNGQQSGDPAKFAAGLVDLASLPEPVLRIAAGAEAALPRAVAPFENKAHDLTKRTPCANSRTTLAHGGAEAPAPYR